MGTTPPAGSRPAGSSLVSTAAPHVGEKYVFGVLVPKDNASWRGPWDCAEFVSWVYFQTAATLYGCNRDDRAPSTADAFSGFWERDARALGQIVSLDVAASTPGAVVLRFPAPGAIGHVVISDGAGGTIEAHSTRDGVIRSTLSNRRWDMGILLPGIDYTQSAPVVTSPPATVIYRLTNPLMTGPKVKAIQLALQSHGFDPGTPDGEFGPHTHAAVVAFQLSEGSLADGEVGPSTAAALGVSL